MDILATELISKRVLSDCMLSFYRRGIVGKKPWRTKNIKTNHYTLITDFDAEGLQNALCYPKEIQKVTIEIPFEVRGKYTPGTWYDPPEYPEFDICVWDIVILSCDNWIPNFRQNVTIIQWLLDNLSNFEQKITEHCHNLYENNRSNQ